MTLPTLPVGPKLAVSFDAVNTACDAMLFDLYGLLRGWQHYCCFWCTNADIARRVDLNINWLGCRMKRIFSKTAFTLIELIVSSVLVSVVVLGIFSINSVLNNNNQDYGQRYLVKSETQATLNHILNNASLAVGSGTQ